MNRVVIIGAGIIGLHMANVMREKGLEVYILEKEAYLAEHISGRNTGVIHAGIFYTPGSFKEKMCIEGNALTYEWLNKLKIEHNPCGKWIVPSKGQEDEVECFFEKASKLPISKPQFISGNALKQQEPKLIQSNALFIPSTGVLDSASYVKALAVYLGNKGVSITMNCLVEEIKDNALITSRGEIPFDLALNCAGLFSDDIAMKTGLSGYEIRPCRGDYYVLNKSPLNKPVYHLPRKDLLGLGLHLTPTLDGLMLIGPSADFIEDKSDYEHHSDRESFYESLAYHIEGIDADKLQPGYSGNRPKLFKNDKPLPEFTIIKKDNWIHLLGIESPGLTAAPALAKHVVGMM